MTQDIAKIAASLTERPRLALLREGWPGGLTWPEVVWLAKKPGDPFSMSYRAVVAPLLRRDLVEVVRPAKYVPETGDYIPQLLALTPLGLAVRTHLLNTTPSTTP